MAMTHPLCSVQAANGFHVLPTRFHRAKYLEPMTLEKQHHKGWLGPLTLRAAARVLGQQEAAGFPQPSAGGAWV